MLCHLLSDCVADSVVALALFEEAIAGEPRGTSPDHGQWERDRARERQREAELEAELGVAWGDPDYFQTSNAIREQARRDVLRQKWVEQGGPEAYRRRLPFIHARSFVTTVALLQRGLFAMCDYELDPHESAAVR